MIKEKLILVLKGFLMGIANVVPGVSGGTLALVLGIYERFIHALSHFFKNIKENIVFLGFIFLGIGLSLITMSNAIDYAYNHFPIPTTLFFMGLVIGGVPLIFSKVKGKVEMKKTSSWVIFAISFFVVIFMMLSNTIFGEMAEVDFSNMGIINYLVLFLVGAIAAATMIIPGISGSLVLMLLGFYYPIINLVKELTRFNDLGSNLIIAAVFGLGILVGIVGISRVVEFLFKRFEVKTYFGVLGFVIASIIAIPFSAFGEIQIEWNVIHILIGLVVSVIGAIIAYKLGEK